MYDATTAKQNIKSSDYISLKVKWIKNAATQLLLTVILTCALCIIKRANRIDHIALLIIHAACVPHWAGGGWKMIKRLVIHIPYFMIIFVRFTCVFCSNGKSSRYDGTIACEVPSSVSACGSSGN